MIQEQPARQSSRKKGLANKIIDLHIDRPELTATQIARRVDCTPQNVSQVIARFVEGTDENELREYQQNKADIFDALQMKAVKSITNDKLAKEAPYNLTLITGILEDKARTIRGQANSINVVVLADVLQAIRDQRKLDGQ